MRKIIYPQEELNIYIQEYKNGNSLSKISEKYHLERHILSRNLQDAGIIITKRKYTVNENIFSTLTHDAAYWIGFIAADGCLQATGNNPTPNVLSFNLNICDKNHLEKFKTFCDSSAQITEYISSVGYGAGTTMAHLEINSRKLVSDLETYGLCRAKSTILKPPLIASEFYLDWIRGYIDGDGSISILNNGNAQISIVGTLEVLEFINQILNDNKPKKLYHPKKNPLINTYQLAYGGRQTIVKKLHLLYDNASSYLDRKYNKTLEIYSRFEK